MSHGRPPACTAQVRILTGTISLCLLCSLTTRALPRHLYCWEHAFLGRQLAYTAQVCIPMCTALE